MFDPFEPTWRRGWLAFAVAAAAFLLPQEAPLAYYPLNHPSDVHYLEITCAASAESETRVYLDSGRGFDELHSIRIPIAPSSQPYTYTFPLWDAPLRGMQLEPLRRPGELAITNLRIYTRSGQEIKRFTRDDFDATHEIAGIVPTADGWKFVTTPNATHPYSLCGFFPPIVPDGMNVRNLQRCLLSWSYLALMLWILLLAVYFVLLRHRDVRAILRAGGFLALVALFFAAVGNRGLIKESMRCALFPVESVKPGLRLEIDLTADPPQAAQLFWNTGQGFNGRESERRNYEPHTLYQTLRFDLPALNKAGATLQALRFDPFDAAGAIRLFGIRVVDQGRRTRLRLPPDCLRAEREITAIDIQGSQVVIRTTPAARDPILEFDPVAVKAIGDVMRTAGEIRYARRH
jgi:hypothetical protein